MSVPELLTSPAPVSDTSAEAILLAVPTVETLPSLEEFPGLVDALQAVGFTGKAGSFARIFVPAITDKKLAVVGLGSDPSANAIREGVGAGVRQFTKVESLAVAVVGLEDVDATAVAEGAALGAYTFNAYKSSGTERAGSITVHAADVDADRAVTLAEAVRLVKDLTNTPGGDLGPADLADAAMKAVADLDVEVTVWDEERLAAEGFGGILGVGVGSARAPRLVRLDYAPEGADRHIALVGKGITFDTGGLSLKPAGSMLNMHGDMGGAATITGVVQAVARLGIKTRVTAWLCIADNMPSGTATKPNDVLRMYGGQTVEVLNTDAEGRLVLGDGLVKASEEKPDLIIDVATLTGAIMVALGVRHTGVFGDDASVAEYLAVSKDAGELAWAMPLPEHMEGELDSPIADMKNANMGSRWGGALFAGLFLRRFVGRVSDADDAPRIPWVHLDVAGSASNEGAPHGYTDKGATGATVRTLIELVSRSATS